MLYEGDNGYTALVAEIEVNQDTGKIVVKRMVAASDVGPISNPDGLRNQVEGGALQGLSRCLGEEVTWDNEKITSVDWRTYHSLPLGFEVPKIEAVLINRTEGEVMGAGETSITLVAAAIGNAIFDATGARIRQVPFTAERIKAALAARRELGSCAGEGLCAQPRRRLTSAGLRKRLHMRRGRRRQPREIVAAFEHGNQPSAGVFVGDFQHHARQIGEVLIGKREAPQRIAEARVEPRRSQHQVRLKEIGGVHQAVLKHAQDFAVSGARRKRAVHDAALALAFAGLVRRRRCRDTTAIGAC